ncbi:MAG TPA: type I DNA topoisomerase, partial [bacterium]|nr:type I DNA topoisomerase [bacterium]
EPTGEKCPTCGSNMFVKRGRFGRFIACERYPDCRTTMPFPMGVKCPKCGIGELVEKRSRRGKYFYGCSRWKPMPKAEKTPEEIAAEKAEKAALKKKGAKAAKAEAAAKAAAEAGGRGKKPEKVKYEVAPDSCDYVSWYKPINEPCPQCGSTFLTERWTKKTGAYKACPNKTCDYKLIPEEPVGDVPDMGGPAEM